ncbi:unnamed protein product [Fraxinus pennsylvanica]|uniref:Uncharacterized protein n=1 Tax=Fraxinus pennsylvanica TaxID=56036 RepID=A0AAD1Z4S8_9LAMI|nr:unnamed protein product [Fraxinus pennsylvanica]
MVNSHILLVSFPGQGHINPSLQFAKRLLQMGVKVTLCTSQSAIRRMSKTASIIPCLTLAPFSDGYDNGWTTADDVQEFFISFRTCGTEAVTNLILAKENEGHPFTHVVYATLITWAGENNEVIELPGLPLVFSSCDLPSFMQSSSPVVYKFSLPLLIEHLEILDRARHKQKVLVNSFDALEFETLRAIKKYDFMGIGPLIPSAFLDGKDPLDTSFGGDLIQKTVDYIDWLNLKDELSVIYVSFGSYSNLSEQQMEEVANGLIKSQKPFLWVTRDGKNGAKQEESNVRSWVKEVEKQGLLENWAESGSCHRWRNCNGR